MKLDSDTLKKRLRYQGAQYSNGSFARGGNGEPHMLTQAADRIEELENAILQTLEENGHLADGENCTLIKLKMVMPNVK